MLKKNIFVYALAAMFIVASAAMSFSQVDPSQTCFNSCPDCCWNLEQAGKQDCYNCGNILFEPCDSVTGQSGTTVTSQPRAFDSEPWDRTPALGWQGYCGNRNVEGFLFDICCCEGDSCGANFAWTLDEYVIQIEIVECSATPGVAPEPIEGVYWTDTNLSLDNVDASLYTDETYTGATNVGNSNVIEIWRFTDEIEYCASRNYNMYEGYATPLAGCETNPTNALIYPDDPCYVGQYTTADYIRVPVDESYFEYQPYPSAGTSTVAGLATDGTFHYPCPVGAWGNVVRTVPVQLWPEGDKPSVLANRALLIDVPTFVYDPELVAGKTVGISIKILEPACPSDTCLICEQVFCVGTFGCDTDPDTNPCALCMPYVTGGTTGVALTNMSATEGPVYLKFTYDGLETYAAPTVPAWSTTTVMVPGEVTSGYGQAYAEFSFDAFVMLYGDGEDGGHAFGYLPRAGVCGCPDCD